MDRPKPLAPDRRFPLWISFLLGMGGVLVTVAGVYELGRRKPPPAPAPAPTAVVHEEPVRALTAQRETERQAKLAEIRQRRAGVDALRRRGRCMDGVLIIKEGNEIRSAGRCTPN